MISSLSVVFPMFNEKEYIVGTVKDTLEVLKEITRDYEIIIVDDASFDGSELIADDLARQNPHIKVAHHRENRKLGGSLKTGFNLARKGYILYSDIDLPFDLREIKTAVRILSKEKADLVAGYCTNKGVEGIRRYIYSIVYNFLVRVLFGLKIRDVNFSFKLIRKDFLRRINLCSEGSFIDAEMVIKAKYAGAKIVQFGVEYFPRTKGKSKLSSFSVILEILKEGFLFKLNLLKDNK